nr:unnamed protein product [Spirometra erinaceieuropaei]
MLKTDDGVELYKDDQKAEHLSRFFQSVFTIEVAVPTDHCNVDNVLTIDSVVLTKPIVQQELLKLKEGTSPGPDEIPAKLLKELATELAEPLSLLFQASLDAGRLPPEWKTAWISPIHKNGSRASANNYRPVSLTSICCKVMDRIIKRELVRVLEQNHLLCDAQHGFRRGRSCLTNLLYCLEQWTRAIDEGNVVHVAYIAFKKAFDSVPHQRLLYKLSRIGETVAEKADLTFTDWTMAFLSFTSLTLSTWTIVAFTIERLISVITPLWQQPRPEVFKTVHFFELTAINPQGCLLLDRDAA